VLATARRFAEALDREDYGEAAALLAPDARYRIGDRVLAGPEAIVASYRENGEWALAALDGVSYESRVEAAGPGRAAITFVDHLEHAMRRHTHTCRQVVTVNPDGRITEIEHQDLPGERERLDAFFLETGVRRTGETG
jgi:hypothetical protein